MLVKVFIYLGGVEYIMKFCPKCGKQVKDSAKFCPNCGFDFAKRDNIVKPTSSTTHQKKRPAAVVPKRKRPKPKSHKALWIMLLIAICIIGGAWFFLNNGKQSTNHSNTTAQSSSTTTASSSSSSATSTTTDSTKLSSDIGPKETAAAITYYAEKSGLDGWDDYLTGNEGINITLHSDEEANDLVTKKGQGMVYGVKGDQDTADLIKHAYTLDADNTVNIYYFTNENSSTDPASPLKSVSKDEIIQYINDHGYASKVKKLGSKVTITNNDQDQGD